MRFPTARSGKLRWGMAASVTLLAVTVSVGTAVAAGPVVTVDPAGPLAAGTQTITVSGTGFDPVGNNGSGIYVVFGPITPAPNYYIDPSIYGAVMWVYPAGQESGQTALMATDGSFSTTIDIPSSFTTPAGPVDCASVACGVITFGAHGSQDRSQDTCTSVTFMAGDAIAPVSPGMSALPVATVAPASMAAPMGSLVPAASGAPADPCAAISGAAAP